MSKKKSKVIYMMITGIYDTTAAEPFDVKVSRHLNEGWTLVGGPVRMAGNNYFGQAVVREVAVEVGLDDLLP